jgi:hypothetical protein
MYITKSLATKDMMSITDITAVTLKTIKTSQSSPPTMIAWISRKHFFSSFFCSEEHFLFSSVLYLGVTAGIEPAT